MATFPISEHQIEQKHKCRVDLGSLLSFEYQQSPFLTPHLSAAPLPTLALRTLMGKLSSKCQMQFYWGFFTSAMSYVSLYLIQQSNQMHHNSCN